MTDQHGDPSRAVRVQARRQVMTDQHGDPHGDPSRAVRVQARRQVIRAAQRGCGTMRI
jgi:hypothetical protein